MIPSLNLRSPFWRAKCTVGEGLSQWHFALHYSPLLPSLLLKVVLTPALIATATLVGRRWGGTMSGWLVGLPLTSAPVVFFLALDQGTAFATTASLAVLLGTISQAAFAVAYARVAIRTGWLPAAAAGSAVFAVATIAFQQVSLSPLPAYGAVLVSLVIGIVFIPRRERPAATDAVPPDWDLPVRIVLATGLVLVLTGIAPRIGAHLSGLLSPFPVYAGVLAIFAHRQAGGSAANKVLQGLLLGLFAFASFFLVLALGLDRLGIGLSFGFATLVALLVQASTLKAVRAIEA